MVKRNSKLRSEKGWRRGLTKFFTFNKLAAFCISTLCAKSFSKFKIQDSVFKMREPNAVFVDNRGKPERFNGENNEL